MTAKLPAPLTSKRNIAAACVLLVAVLIGGFVADIRSFDQTRGGYEPPYTGYTGTPIDWRMVETTRTGMRKNGYVVDVHADCTSGRMHLNFFGIMVPFRNFLARALVVHKPRAREPILSRIACV